MGKEYTAKSFRSGNSVAIRMPAALGVEPDREWTVVEEDGELTLRLKDRAKRKFNIDKVWGIGRNLHLEFIRDEDRVFEQRPLLREDADQLSSVARPKP